MAIKDWKKKIYTHGLIRFSKGTTRIYIDDGDVDMYDTKVGLSDKKRRFRNKAKSMSYAKSYMRSH